MTTMTVSTSELKHKAYVAKLMYQTGRISRAEAKAEIQPYIDLFNEKSKEIAKKYNQKAKTISFISYVR